jgi:hypothetical protein
MLIRRDLHSVSDIAQCYSETKIVKEHHIHKFELKYSGLQILLSKSV